MAYDLVTGDTGSILQVTCKDNDTSTAINLTGSTVKARWEDATGAVVTKTMTVTTAASGIAQYQFLTGEIIAPKMKIEIEITDSGSKVVSNLALIELLVREQLG